MYVLPQVHASMGFSNSDDRLNMTHCDRNTTSPLKGICTQNRSIGIVIMEKKDLLIITGIAAKHSIVGYQSSPICRIKNSNFHYRGYPDVFMERHASIIESVDSISRDGMDTPYI